MFVAWLVVALQPVQEKASLLSKKLPSSIFGKGFSNLQAKSPNHKIHDPTEQETQ